MSHRVPFFQVYHTHVKRSDGSRSWSGGKDLAQSAMFTWAFCKALFECWEQRDQGSSEVSEEIAGPEMVVISSQSDCEGQMGS